ncbi:hypothetical protein [Spirosoma oryzicola]|uniref:hypothetical protein n=1 Tax=Spirosoma oryzicola TaxID=2898794 RepID=UPI001E2AF6B5|nr:hypothetical protein [Spirosoma oryzicola]UHG93221.1 hypothetical protein LQ777_10050 [Spirosoma oryzicola]
MKVRFSFDACKAVALEVDMDFAPQGGQQVRFPPSVLKDKDGNMVFSPDDYKFIYFEVLSSDIIFSDDMSYYIQVDLTPEEQ